MQGVEIMKKKKCVSCKTEKILSEFNKNKNSKDGHKEYCRECARKQNKRYREKYKDEINEKKRIAYHNSKAYAEEKTLEELQKGNKICTVCKEKKPITRFYKRGNGGFYNYCKDCQSESFERYVQQNREEYLRRKRESYQRNRDKAIKYFKQYNIKNSQNNVERARVWRKENPDRYRELNRQAQQRRMARSKQLIDDFTNEEWEDCKMYFENKCAYCGKDTDNLTQDHFIPLSKDGHYTKTNILPVCGNCNSQKSNTDFIEWYKTKSFYSEQKIKKINHYFNDINYDNSEPSIMKTL